MTITETANYLSFDWGQHVKLLTNKSFVWGMVFGQYCYAHALNSDESYLIIGGTFTNSAFAKVNSSDGAVIKSYSYSSSTYDPK